MTNKLLIVCVLITVLVIEEALTLTGGNCPTASRIDSCSPKCKETSNCHGAQICCTNICGTKSCTDQYQYASGSNDKYNKGSKGGSTGGYCGNTKCSSNEKCELDRTTKREKCVRG